MPPPPDVGDGATPPQAIAARSTAQASFAAHTLKRRRAGPLLVARFIGRQVAGELAKMIPPTTRSVLSDLPEADVPGYALYDHMERLRFLEVKVPEVDTRLLRGVLETALPGLETFVSDERHAMMIGKLAYNAFGVSFGGGRDDRVGLTYICASRSAKLTFLARADRAPRRR